MSSTYRAFEVTGQRQFKLVERQRRREPAPGEVRLRVQACGVCHSDVLVVEGLRADPSNGLCRAMRSPVWSRPLGRG
ncbi:MAG: alcohol dehydrogenase catalytic domain-containing protein [Mycobacterium sp.]